MSEKTYKEKLKLVHAMRWNVQNEANEVLFTFNRAVSEAELTRVWALVQRWLATEGPP
jgi:hypothetical protein